jgi:chitin synthase
MRPTKDAKQAWREKVALFLIMVSCSVFFVGVFGFVPLLLCNEEVVYSLQDIWLQTGENWVIVHGVIYDVKDLIYKHPGGVDGIVDFLGKDASKVFPRAPPATLPEKCLDMQKVDAFQLNVYSPENNFTNPTCASFTELDQLLGITCHTFAAGSNGTQKFLGPYERGILKHTTYALQELGVSYITIYDRVYDVTTYVRDIRQNQEPAPSGEEPSLNNNPSAWLTPTLNKVIMNSLNSDATDLYEALFGSTEYIACLEELFYTGLLDDDPNTFCATLNIMMYVMLILVALLMVIQFLASMIYICPRNRTYTEEDVMSPVMIMVPCYNEGDNELRKTIKSVLNTSYPDENKVLFMVADGLVTGNGEDMSTPEHLANILGFDIDEFEDDTFEYDCIGVVHTKNRARVYHGILQKGHKFLKYIAVVKCGLPEEATTSAKPGNRGKRDSQLITIGYFNRIHYGRELTELDSAVQRAMVDLNLQADMVRFLMAIDADTRVDTMSITHMVYGMDKKEKVLALCGETKVDNKASSWVTMIQVFEYYNSHHLKKAFEAAFGCVTCLPGCFTMYRIIADDGTPLLPGDGVLWEYSRNDVETLHEKNLYHLGEDRMLTTLLLKYYPDRSLTFIPEATCWTIVPHTFKILLSQRRRWINSTVHNMFELLKVNTMCGVCCASMKVVVFIDLIATMILPASYCYAMYLLFLVFFEDLPVSTVLLILYAIIMGVQVVVFILRSRWEYIWWFFIYFTIGLPVFYLILPTYSFWNMDDFSWGKTRSVGGSAANNAASSGDDEEDDEEDEEARSLMDKDRDTRGYSDEEDEDDDEMLSAKNYDNEDERSTESSSEEEESGDEETSDEESDDDSGSENEHSRSQYSSSRRSAYSGSRSSRR